MTRRKNCFMARRKTLEQLRHKIASLGHKLFLEESVGTQQDDKNVVSCLGCGGQYTVTGDRLYRVPKKNPFYICESKCAKVWDAEQLQEELDLDGKLVDIVCSKFEGRGRGHNNSVECRVCDESYTIHGRALCRKIESGGSRTPKCPNCIPERKREHAVEFLLPTLPGPKFGIEEANRKQREKGKTGTILEWNGTRTGSGDDIRPAPALYQCGECETVFPTFGTTILDPDCKTNNCPKCGPEIRRESAYKMHKKLGFFSYNLDLVKKTIEKRQKRDVLDLSKITQFNNIDDLVDVYCKTHNKEFRGIPLWGLIRGNTPCKECRGELIGFSQQSPWDETEEEMRKVEGKHITYFPHTYQGRSNKMLKHCNKDGHNKKDKGYFEQAPKQTILQYSSCRDCAHSGFKKSKPAYAYLLRYSFSDQNIGTKYKQGIMNKKKGLSVKSDIIHNEDVKSRIKKLKSSVNKIYPGTKVDVVDWVHFELGADAFVEEKWFKALENIRWLPEGKFEGFKEMYSEKVVEIWRERRGGGFQNSSEVN